MSIFGCCCFLGCVAQGEKSKKTPDMKNNVKSKKNQGSTKTDSRQLSLTSFFKTLKEEAQ